MIFVELKLLVLRRFAVTGMRFMEVWAQTFLFFLVRFRE